MKWSGAKKVEKYKEQTIVDDQGNWYDFEADPIEYKRAWKWL